MWTLNSFLHWSFTFYIIWLSSASFLLVGQIVYRKHCLLTSSVSWLNALFLTPDIILREETSSSSMPHGSALRELSVSGGILLVCLLMFLIVFVLRLAVDFSGNFFLVWRPL